MVPGLFVAGVNLAGAMLLVHVLVLRLEHLLEPEPTNDVAPSGRFPAAVDPTA